MVRDPRCLHDEAICAQVPVRGVDIRAANVQNGVIMRGDMGRVGRGRPGVSISASLTVTPTKSNSAITTEQEFRVSIPNNRPLLRRPTHPGDMLREDFMPDYELVRILKLVIPANAGIHLGLVHMDSRLRGNDERASKPGFRTDTS